jgi:TonB family protein
MKEKDKKKKSELSGFLRYSGNKMTNRERNSFERELQKDPFSEQAAEGFAEISAKEAEEDLIILKKRLNARTVRKKRFIFYRIAASVAVLIAITSLFILIERDRSSKLNNEITNNQVAFAIPESAPLTRPADRAGVKEKIPSPALIEEDISVAGQTGKEAEKEETQTNKAKSETIITKEYAHALEIKEFERIIPDDQKAAPVAAINREEAAAGAVSRSDMKKKLSETEYSPPEPVTGRKNFDKYIEDNLRCPDILTESERAFVVVSFVVLSNGIIDSIKIIRSPGRQFSDEAIRLIKEGPRWKPANENGEPINDEVRIRIVFK